MSVRNDIEMVIKKSNIDFFGVASLDRFEYAPEGRKPTDIMPNAKSVISLGIKIPRGVMIAQTQFYKGFDSGKFIYQQYSYHVPNLFLDSAAMNVAQMLENKYGWSSIPIPNAMPFARASLEAVVSHRQVACAAGLGEMGWSNVMMHPDIGGAGRYTSIITEGDIKPNPLYKGEPLCDPDKCGRICVKACPINVFSESESVSFQINNRKFYMSVMDKIYCMAVQNAYSRNGVDQNDLSQKTWMGIRPTISPEWIVQRITRTNIANRKCGKCLVLCPVTREKLGIG